MILNNFDWIKGFPKDFLQTESIITSDRTYTYRDLEVITDSLSFRLKNNFKIQPNDYVGILSENTPEFIILVLSLWKLNAIPVLLNCRLLSNEINEQLDFVNAKQFFYQNKFDITKSGKYESEKIENLLSNLQLKQNDDIPIPSLNNPAVIIFTSGSSGKPKAVNITFRNLLASVKNGEQVLNHQLGDRWLASLPFYHIGGFSIILRSLLSGSVLVIPDSLETNDLAKAIKNHKPTLASLVSTQLKKLLEADVKPNKELRNILLGGGFILRDLIHEAVNSGWKISKVYGSTETTAFVTALSYNEINLKPDSAGKPLRQNKIFIVDDNRKKVESGTSGEIVIQSDAVAAGYVSNPEETVKKFKGNIYYTGDFGYIDEDGYFYIEAKRTDMIVTGGENVNPVEIEDVLKTINEIKDVCVIGTKDEKWGEVVTAVIVPSGKKEISVEEIKSSLKGKISSYKIPKKIIFVEDIPRTELGKIQREKLKEQFD